MYKVLASRVMRFVSPSLAMRLPSTVVHDDPDGSSFGHCQLKCKVFLRPVVTCYNATRFLRKFSFAPVKRMWASWALIRSHRVLA